MSGKYSNVNVTVEVFVVVRKMSCVVLLSAGEYVVLHVKVALWKKQLSTFIFGGHSI